jgi:hypothetical protein
MKRTVLGTAMLMIMAIGAFANGAKDNENKRCCKEAACEKKECKESSACCNETKDCCKEQQACCAQGCCGSQDKKK